MSSVTDTKLPLWDRAQVFLVLLPARELFVILFIVELKKGINTAFLLVWVLLKAPFTAYGRAKSWKRKLFDRLVGFIRDEQESGTSYIRTNPSNLLQFYV